MSRRILKMILTKTQIERVKREIKELTVNLEKATAKLNNTIEMIKTDVTWTMFLEEDTKKVEYYKRHINRLTVMLEGVA